MAAIKPRYGENVEDSTEDSLNVSLPGGKPSSEPQSAETDFDDDYYDEEDFDEEGSDEDYDEDDDMQQFPSERKKGSVFPVVLVLLLLFAGTFVGLTIFGIIDLPFLNRTSPTGFSVIVPSGFEVFGNDELVSDWLEEENLFLHPFSSSSLTISRASGVSPGVGAAIVTNQVALDRVSQWGTVAPNQFTTPLVFVTTSLVADDLSELGVVVQDDTRVLDVGRLMLEIGRGSLYDIWVPHLQDTDMGNWAWVMFSLSLEGSQADSGVQAQIASVVNSRFSQQTWVTADVFNQLESGFLDGLAVVSEALVVQDVLENPERWIAGDNRLVVLYPHISTVVPIHAVTFTEQGSAWFGHFGQMSNLEVWTRLGFRDSERNAPVLNPTLVQAGIRATIAPHQALVSNQRFIELISGAP